MRSSYYDEACTKELTLAVDNGLRMGEMMHMSDLNENQITAEYPAGIPRFTAEQMREIRLGYEAGLDPETVGLYACPEYTADQMEAIRRKFTEEDVISETMEGIREDDFEVTREQVERHVQQEADQRHSRDRPNPFQIDEVAIRLVKERTYYSDTPLLTPEAVMKVVGEELSQYDREVVALVYCTSALRPINVTICSMGSINRAIICPREMLKAAILSNASIAFVMHTHPSGDSSPSRMDITVTEQLRKVFAMMEIELKDHIIVGDDNYYSFQEHGFLDEGVIHRGEDEYKHRVVQKEGMWISCKVMLEDENGELHDTGQERFFDSQKAADEYKKQMEGGADESVAYANSIGFEMSQKSREGLIL